MHLHAENGFNVAHYWAAERQKMNSLIYFNMISVKSRSNNKSFLQKSSAYRKSRSAVRRLFLVNIHNASAFLRKTLDFRAQALTAHTRIPFLILDGPHDRITSLSREVCFKTFNREKSQSHKASRKLLNWLWILPVDLVRTISDWTTLTLKYGFGKSNNFSWAIHGEASW